MSPVCGWALLWLAMKAYSLVGGDTGVAVSAEVLVLVFDADQVVRIFLMSCSSLFWHQSSLNWAQWRRTSGSETFSYLLRCFRREYARVVTKSNIVLLLQSQTWNEGHGYRWSPGWRWQLCHPGSGQWHPELATVAHRFYSSENAHEMTVGVDSQSWRGYQQVHAGGAGAWWPGWSSMGQWPSAACTGMCAFTCSLTVVDLWQWATNLEALAITFLTGPTVWNTKLV